MMLARLARSFLAVVAAAIVAWSFYDVGRRVWDEHRDPRPITLTVLHWGAPSEDQIVANIVAAYQREHPNVRIIRINPGDADTTRNKLLTMLAAGQPPDVFYLPPDLLPKLANLKIIRSLEPFVAKEDKAWMDDFVPVVLNAFRFDTATGTMGRGPLYALPKDFTTTGFYININLFDAAGIDWRFIQKHGWTWDQFTADMRKINALRDRPEFKGRRIYGTFFWLWPDTIRDILWTFGGEFFHTDADGHPLFRETALDTPESQAGLKYHPPDAAGMAVVLQPDGHGEGRVAGIHQWEYRLRRSGGHVDGADLQDDHRFQMGCRPGAVRQGAGVDRVPHRLDDEQRLPRTGGGLSTHSLFMRP